MQPINNACRTDALRVASKEDNLHTHDLTSIIISPTFYGNLKNHYTETIMKPPNAERSE